MTLMLQIENRKSRCPFLLVLLVCQAALWSQTQLSTLRGTVVDPSGAVVPGVSVVAEEIATEIKARTVVTDNQGNYEIPDIKAGTYRVRATMAGFKGFTASDIVLESNQIKRVDVQLQIGEASSEVTVNEAARVIETEDSKLSAEFTGEQYKFAPLPGNAYSSPLPVVATMPNVHFAAGCQFCLTMAGQVANQMGMDGVKEENTNTQTVNMEDAAEVKAVAVNNSAEFSRAAYFNVVTKHGTNQFHGEASYYHRNSALGARGFFDSEKEHQLYHTFNLSASGPIIKDKTFFYALWNGERVPQHTFHLNDVPTNQMRTGDFSQLAALDSSFSLTDPTTGKPFAGNMIPSDRLNAVSLSVQNKYLPVPNRNGPDALVNNFGWVFPYPEDQYRADVFVTRIDHQLTSKDSLFGRLSVYLPRYVLSGNYPALAWTRLRQSHSWAAGDTHVFSPSLVNTFTFGGNRDRVSDGEKVDGYQPPTGNTVVEAIGLQGVNPQGYSAMGFPVMKISGYSDITVQPGGVTDIAKNFSYADSLSWSKGRHVLKFGEELRLLSDFNGGIPENTYGSFSFDGRFTGNAYGDFLLGLPATSTRLNPLIKRKQTAKELGLFVTDTFKVNSRLNLDLGLRWDYFGTPRFEDGLQYNWDLDTGQVIVPQSAISRISPLYDPRIKVVAGDAYPHPDKRLFVPRIGAAYRISNNTVVRGGYGIFNETLGVYTQSQNQGNGPFGIAETYTNTITNGVPLFSFPNPFPSSAGSAQVPSQAVYGFPHDTSNGHIQQYNVTIEQQIHDFGVRLSYAGSRGSGLNYQLELNKPQPSLIPFSDDRRPFPQFVSTVYDRHNGETKYNSMTIEGTRRVGSFMFDVHWTWAHGMSNFLNEYASPGSLPGIGFLDNPYAPLFWNRDFEPKHRVVLNLTWDLPVGRGARYLTNVPGAVNQVIGGWKLYWISFLQTGQYFSPVFSGSDPSNTNTFGGLPDRIANGNLATDQRTVDRWFNVGAYAIPGCPNADPTCSSPASIGRLGNSGINVLEGPGLSSHSVSLAKRIRISERLHFDFMAMISNLFNHPNFFAPQNDIAVPGQAGVISGQHGLFSAERSGPRLVELRGRLEF